MAKNKKTNTNTNFRLGLNRQELIQAAQIFGKSEKTAKKDSTKRLEEYLTRRLSGQTKTSVPTLPDRAKRDIKDAVNDFGIYDAVHSVSYHVKRATGNRDENNYLRLSVGRAFTPYADGLVTPEMIDEILTRVGDGSRDEIISGLQQGKNAYYYNVILGDYADELAEEKANENAIAEQQAQEQFNNQVPSTASKGNPKKSKSKKR